MNKTLILDNTSLLVLREMIEGLKTKVTVDKLRDDFTVYDCYLGGCSNVCDGCTGCTSCDGCSGGCAGGFTYG